MALIVLTFVPFSLHIKTKSFFTFIHFDVRVYLFMLVQIVGIVGSVVTL